MSPFVSRNITSVIRYGLLNSEFNSLSSKEMSSSDGKDVANLALIYSTLAVMGKNIELKKGSASTMIPKRDAKEETIDNNALDSNEDIKLDSEVLSDFENTFLNILDRFKVSSAEALEMEETDSEPQVVSEDTVLLRRDFAIELKQLVDSEVRFGICEIKLHINKMGC